MAILPVKREEDLKNWHWLPAELGMRLQAIRKAVEAIFEAHKNTKHLKFYTPHDSGHSSAVEDNIHKLVPGPLHQDFSEDEKFFLLAGAWLHDLGMMREIFEGDDELDDDSIRDEHHNRSQRYISQHYRTLQIKEHEVEVFGHLARFHRRREDLLTCPQSLNIRDHGTIRVRLLAAYLRLADALHMDSTRAPSDQYAISLTYNIPFRTKLHWMKSTFVSGIEIDSERRTIIVQFKKPLNLTTEQEERLRIPFSGVYGYVLQDLNEEIDSVKNVLLQTGISWYLNAESQEIPTPFDPKKLAEIIPVMTYHHLLDNASSSALLKLLLQTLEGILEATFPKGRAILVTKKTAEPILSFLEEIKGNLLSFRKNHIGLQQLIKEVESLLAFPTSADNLMDWLKKKKSLLDGKRHSLCGSAKRYFKSHYLDSLTLSGLEAKMMKSPPAVINVLLYGYSELVLKSLIGFRASIAAELLKHDLQGDTIEDDKTRHDFASSHFRLFCCEGQPKNHTAWGGKILHHDGIKYALGLAEAGFTNIHIIPDVVAPTLIAGGLPSSVGGVSIDIVMLGANGFNNTHFHHSAGHFMVVSAAWVKQIKKINKPTVVLATVTDKYTPGSAVEAQSGPSNNDHIDKSGWKFKGPFGKESVRDLSFFVQDEKVKKELRRWPAISFYNPREDEIPLHDVDVVITERSFYCKNHYAPDHWNGATIAEIS